MSVVLKELGAAMAKAQAEIKSAKKDAANPFFKSKYADLASVVSACRDAFAKHGLSVIQATDFEGDVMWLETYLMHSSGEFIKGRYPIRPLKNDPQSVGSAISYAKRYTYAAIAGVVTGDEDDDGNAASDRKEESAPNKPEPVFVQKGMTTDEAEHYANDFAGLVAKATNNAEIDDLVRRERKHITDLQENYWPLYESLQAIVKSTRSKFATKAAAE